jgi:hypothetical protein
MNSASCPTNYRTPQPRVASAVVFLFLLAALGHLISPVSVLANAVQQAELGQYQSHSQGGQGQRLGSGLGCSENLFQFQLAPDPARTCDIPQPTRN